MWKIIRLFSGQFLFKFGKKRPQVDYLGQNEIFLLFFFSKEEAS